MKSMFSKLGMPGVRRKAFSRWHEQSPFPLFPTSPPTRTTEPRPVFSKRNAFAGVHLFSSRMIRHGCRGNYLLHTKSRVSMSRTSDRHHQKTLAHSSPLFLRHQKIEAYMCKRLSGHPSLALYASRHTAESRTLGKPHLPYPHRVLQPGPTTKRLKELTQLIQILHSTLASNPLSARPRFCCIWRNKTILREPIYIVQNQRIHENIPQPSVIAFTG